MVDKLQQRAISDSLSVNRSGDGVIAIALVVLSSMTCDGMQPTS